MEGLWPYPDASVFGELRSLTKLALEFNSPRPCALAAVVGALVPLTRLSELSIGFGHEPAVVPAALGQLKGLRALDFMGLIPCSYEAGCLDLPILRSPAFNWCRFWDGEVLPGGVTALQRLTGIKFVDCCFVDCCKDSLERPRFINHHIFQLSHLQRIMPPHSPGPVTLCGMQAL